MPRKEAREERWAYFWAVVASLSFVGVFELGNTLLIGLGVFASAGVIIQAALILAQQIQSNLETTEKLERSPVDHCE